MSAIRVRSAGERMLSEHLRLLKLPPHEVEFQFHPKRRWRFDFSFPEHRLAVEVEGATFANGRHSRGTGFAEDCVKYAHAAILGWRVIRCTTDQVRQGLAVEWIRLALQSAGAANAGHSEIGDGANSVQERRKEGASHMGGATPISTQPRGRIRSGEAS